MSLEPLKALLCRIGAYVPPRMIQLGNGVLNYLNLGRWFRDRGLKVPIRFDDLNAMYGEAARCVREPASYIEFGVFEGTSLRRWTALLKHPDSFFHGFDSFQGLPESWGSIGRDHFDVRGKMPEFDDPRVSLFKGWFSETLPAYVRDFKPYDSLIIHFDADLYSSTACVFEHLRPFIKRGTVLIFDELWDREHELKAFSEFLDATRCKVECLAATRTLSQAAFRVSAI